tara:strand:- start:1810 stop:2103 length:294 start_codon:yes stop_codon:yes gene_type:complete
MTDLLIGLGLLPILILVNYVVLTLCKFFPKYILALSGVMIGLDTIMTLGYTFTANIFVTEIKLMVGGVGLAIFAALAHKVLTFIKELGALNKHEIGN